MTKRPRVVQQCSLMTVVFFSISCLAFAAPALGNAFEGTWSVTVSAEDGSRSYADTLTFKPAQFESKKLKSDGFEPAPYEVDTRGRQSATFTATQKGKAGQAAWTGTAAAGEFVGRLVITTPSGSATTYLVKGSRDPK